MPAHRYADSGYARQLAAAGLIPSSGTYEVEEMSLTSSGDEEDDHVVPIGLSKRETPIATRVGREVNAFLDEEGTPLSQRDAGRGRLYGTEDFDDDDYAAVHRAMRLAAAAVEEEEITRGFRGVRDGVTGITVTAEDKADMRAFLSFLRHSPA